MVSKNHRYVDRNFDGESDQNFRRRFWIIFSSSQVDLHKIVKLEVSVVQTKIVAASH